MKKIYVKPNAEYITFYSEEEIARVIPLEEGSESDVGGGVVGGSVSDTDKPADWV